MHSVLNTVCRSGRWLPCWTRTAMGLSPLLSSSSDCGKQRSRCDGVVDAAEAAEFDSLWLCPWWSATACRSEQRRRSRSRSQSGGRQLRRSTTASCRPRRLSTMSSGSRAGIGVWGGRAAALIYSTLHGDPAESLAVVADAATAGQIRPRPASDAESADRFGRSENCGHCLGDEDPCDEFCLTGAARRGVHVRRVQQEARRSVVRGGVRHWRPVLCQPRNRADPVGGPSTHRREEEDGQTRPVSAPYTWPTCAPWSG